MEEGLRVAVLGDTRARTGGREIDLGTPRQRGVLAALALHRGRPVPVDQLADLLWGEAPPRSVTVTLQGYVAGLRRALEPDRAPRSPSSVVVLETQGYALRVDPDALDVAVLEREATVLHGSTDHQQVLARADAVLALWTGAPFAALGDHPSVVAERERLDGLRLQLLEDRATARLALGQDAEVAADLEPLTSSYPLREHLWALRARALARVGRQADALAVLRTVRETLADELGVEPGAELRDLQLAVLRQEEQRAAAPSSPPRVVLGHAAWPLVGRERELDLLLGALAATRAGTPQPRFATLAGEPGIGKSRLGQELVLAAQQTGVRVLAGRCLPDDAPALWPWRQVVEGIGRRLPSGSGTEPGEAFRARDELVGGVLAAAAQAPTLLVLEDLHWADASSLQALRRLVTVADGVRLLVVATWLSAGSMAWCSTSMASSTARSSSVVRSRSHGHSTTSSASWWCCSWAASNDQRCASRRQVARSSAGVRRAARQNRSRSRRKAWWNRYITTMSTGPSGAAAWPGRRVWVGHAAVVSSLMDPPWPTPLEDDWEPTGSRLGADR